MTDSFATVTTVAPTGPGRYEATIDESWNLRPLPQGGIVSAIALRAMADALAEPTQALRSLHTTFVAQVAHGPVSVDVEVLRRGRSMSHLRAEVANPGAARGHMTTGIFGSTRPGFSFTDLDPPGQVPPPGTAPPTAIPRRQAWSPSSPRRSGSSTSRDGRPSGIRSGRSTFPTGRRRRPGTGSTILPSSTTARSIPWRWWCWLTPCPARSQRRSAACRSELVRPERRPHRAPPRSLPLPLGAGPQPGPLRRRRVRLGRDGSVGPRRGRCRRAAGLVAYATQLFLFSFSP